MATVPGNEELPLGDASGSGGRWLDGPERPSYDAPGTRPAAARWRPSVYRRTAPLALSLLFSLPAFVPAQEAGKPPLLTVAEKSDYRATARYAEVMDFCRQLAERAPAVRLT